MSEPAPSVPASAQLTAETYPPGEILVGRYRVVRALGEGGMGQVYECEHVEVGRRLALKVLQPWLATHEVAARFRTEARAASAAGHPNIVDVFDAGDLEDGRPFIAMEFLDGEELLSAISYDSGLSLDRTLAIGSAVARALQAAHEVGVIHRDLKPENVMLVQRDGIEVVKVVDFGIAFEAAPERTTRAGLAVGTPEYMSPEQARGEPGDARFDVYALGVLLFEMMSARLPYEANTALGLLEKKCAEPPKSLAEFCSDAPAALVTLVACCMDPDASKRPATAREVGAALDAIAAAAQAPARAPTPTAILDATAAAAQARPSWAMPALIGGGVVAATVLLLLLLRPGSERANTSWGGFPYVVSSLAQALPIPEPEPEWVEPELEPEVVEPEPEPEVVEPPPRPKTRTPSRNLPTVDAPKPKPKPEPKPKPTPSADCEGVERAGRAAREKHLWQPMMKALSKTQCWSDRGERKKLRVLGLKEQGRFEACVTAAKGIEDSEVRGWAATCAKRAAK